MIDDNSQAWTARVGVFVARRDEKFHLLLRFAHRLRQNQRITTIYVEWH
jgi:hypothetical protein